MERRQSSGQRCKIMQDAIRDLMDEIERIVCYLYIQNFDDYEVMKELHIDRKRLKEIKTGIRRKLVEAGIKDTEVKIKTGLQTASKTLRA